MILLYQMGVRLVSCSFCGSVTLLPPLESFQCRYVWLPVLRERVVWLLTAGLALTGLFPARCHGPTSPHGGWAPTGHVLLRVERSQGREDLLPM